MAIKKFQVNFEWGEPVVLETVKTNFIAKKFLHRLLAVSGMATLLLLSNSCVSANSEFDKKHPTAFGLGWIGDGRNGSSGSAFVKVRKFQLHLNGSHVDYISKKEQVEKNKTPETVSSSSSSEYYENSEPKDLVKLYTGNLLVLSFLSGTPFYYGGGFSWANHSEFGNGHGLVVASGLKFATSSFVSLYAQAGIGGGIYYYNTSDYKGIIPGFFTDAALGLQVRF